MKQTLSNLPMLIIKPKTEGNYWVIEFQMRDKPRSDCSEICDKLQCTQCNFFLNNQNPKPELRSFSSSSVMFLTSTSNIIFKARTLFNTIFENKKPWQICTYFQIQSPIFGSASKRGYIFWGEFLPCFFYTFGFIRSVKTFSKVPGFGMNIDPYMAYVLYI